MQAGNSPTQERNNVIYDHSTWTPLIKFQNCGFFFFGSPWHTPVFPPLAPAHRFRSMFSSPVCASSIFVPTLPLSLLYIVALSILHIVFLPPLPATRNTINRQTIKPAPGPPANIKASPY